LCNSLVTSGLVISEPIGLSRKLHKSSEIVVGLVKPDGGSGVVFLVVVFLTFSFFSTGSFFSPISFFPLSFCCFFNSFSNRYLKDTICVAKVEIDVLIFIISV
jgi:hypothetical protein